MSNKIVAAFVSALAVLAVVPVTAALAQATRTWVSGVGDDVNPCSRTAPCKTFAGTISKTAAGGEISVLDPGGFGAVTITKSISLIAEGNEGGITTGAGNGIIVNAGPNDVVHIRGLTIEGGGSGLSGVRVLSAAEVFIQRCIIRGIKGSPGVAVEVNPTVAGNKVVITNTILAASIRGIGATPTGAGNTQVFLDNVQITDVGAAVSADANATIRVNDSAITDVNNAFTTTGSGKVISFGNNAVAGNTNAGSDVPSNVIPLK